MKRYGITFLVAISLLVATPRGMGAHSNPVSLQTTTFSSPIILSQTPPAASNSSIELIKIIGGSIVGGVVGFIACWKFFKSELPEINRKNSEQNSQRTRRIVTDAFISALEDSTFKQKFQEKLKGLLVDETYDQKKLFEYCLGKSFKDSESKQEFQNKLRGLFVIEKYELEYKLFEHCLNISLEEFLSNSTSKNTLNRQLKDIIAFFVSGDRAQIGQMRQDIDALREKVRILTEKMSL
ncbi:hypothetical protein [Nodosilinea sp. P-1105]|uniref:hypothetical protein n=1 Tax=Nodosilinea sp. P-1105 TaxID=2546229 RepID=UPI00146F8926|nr:hypothetical protein [Nodosilinea sp. P-1105]NMF85516.1 hypothetical protein [Nodosilinea sp. P-1105]